MNVPTQAMGLRPRVETPLRLNDAVPATSSWTDEVEAVAWLQGEVAESRRLPLLEAELVIHSLFTEQRRGGKLPLPLIEVRRTSDFLAVHAVNVASVSMFLAEALEFEPAAVRRVGLAALLHDIGMVRLPREIVEKEGQVTAAEREKVKLHPILGARILLAADASLDLAATVAYEHHLRMDGSGYPQLLYPRSAHYVSRLVQLCDVFCGLHSERPYRKAWPLDIIISFFTERRGFEFHPTLTAALTTLLQQHQQAAAMM